MPDNYSLIKQSLSDSNFSPDSGLVIAKMSQVFSFVDLIEQAHMLPKGVDKPGAVVAIVAGSRIGLDPFQAVQGIAIINGRPAVWGDALVAIVKASGLVEDETVQWFTNDQKERVAVRYTVKRKGVETPYVGEFSQKMAIKARLWGKDGPWTQYPHRMMLARARAFALRDGFADVLKGIRSAEEERDIAAGAPADIPAGDAASDASDNGTETVVVKSYERAAPKRRKTAAEAFSEPVEIVEIVDVGQPETKAEAPTEALPPPEPLPSAEQVDEALATDLLN